MIKIKSYLLLFLLANCVNNLCKAQVLTLNDAVQTGLKNYASIKAKGNYIKSSQATVEQTKKEALPNLILSLQQDYGTVNGSNGPLYGLGGYQHKLGFLHFWPCKRTD
jgi:outer membrane protein TolC